MNRCIRTQSHLFKPPHSFPFEKADCSAHLLSDKENFFPPPVCSGFGLCPLASHCCYSIHENTMLNGNWLDLLSLISSGEATSFGGPSSHDTSQIHDNSLLVSRDPSSSSLWRGDHKSLLWSRYFSRIVHSPFGSIDESALYAALYRSAARMVLSWKRLIRDRVRVFDFWLRPPTWTFL